MHVKTKKSNQFKIRQIGMMLRFILCWTLRRQSYVEAGTREKGEKKNFDVPLCCSGSSSIFIFRFSNEDILLRFHYNVYVNLINLN